VKRWLLKFTDRKGFEKTLVQAFKACPPRDFRFPLLPRRVLHWLPEHHMTDHGKASLTETATFELVNLDEARNAGVATYEEI
jgi:hypothetical protein